MDAYGEANLLLHTDDSLTSKTADMMVATKGSQSALHHLSELLKRGARPVALMRRALLRVRVATKELDASADDFEHQRDTLLNGAVADLTEILATDKAHAEAYLVRGCLEANTPGGASAAKTRKRAMDDLAMAIALRPNDARPYLARAMTHESYGATHEAIPDYLSAARLMPRNCGFPLVAVANIYAHCLRDDATAIFYCVRALHAEPHCTRALLVRAECFHRIGDPARAVADARRAMRYAPDRPLHRALHARYLLAAGRVRAAAAEC